jgi:Major capsid protein N-terminus/Large eukaryotic DNA virus major capsid protein
MSGGVVQLVATGPQDAWLTGKPEVSFFRSNYKRYTQFSSSIERQVIQGTPIAGGISTIRLEKKGDLVNFMYLTATDTNGATISTLNWSKIIDKIDLYIGGQIVDTQDIQYMTGIEPLTGAQTFSQRYLNLSGSSQFTNEKAAFLPLKFFFNKDWSVSLPLVALQFHDVEIRITWSANLGTAVSNQSPQLPLYTSSPAGTYAGLQYQAWANFTYLDQAERDWFAKSSHDLLVTQVQRVIMSTSSTQELALSQPVKFLAFNCQNYNTAYNTSGATAQKAPLTWQLKTQVNGVDVGESRHLPHWVDVPHYYTMPYGYFHTTTLANILVIPYCLDTSKLQPTGTLNFSRLDTYRIVVPPGITQTDGTTGNGLKTLWDSSVPYSTAYIYAVNYNVLRIQNGLGSLMYAN